MKERKRSNFIANCDAISTLGIKVAKISAIVLALSTLVVASASIMADNKARKLKRAKLNEIINKFNDNKKS